MYNIIRLCFVSIFFNNMYILLNFKLLPKFIQLYRYQHNTDFLLVIHDCAPELCIGIMHLGFCSGNTIEIYF